MNNAIMVVHARIDQGIWTLQGQCRASSNRIGSFLCTSLNALRAWPSNIGFRHGHWLPTLVVVYTLLHRRRSWFSCIDQGLCTLLSCCQAWNSRISISLQIKVKRHEVLPTSLSFYLHDGQLTSSVALLHYLRTVHNSQPMSDMYCFHRFYSLHNG